MNYFLIYLLGVFITFAVLFYIFYKKSLESLSLLSDSFETCLVSATILAIFWPISVPIIIIAKIIMVIVEW
jgi:hypothetical protein